MHLEGIGELTKVDMVFSILVVRLSMMIDNSSSVMSSRMHGPRYVGGTRCCEAVFVVVGGGRIVRVFGDDSNPGEPAGDPGECGA